MNEHLDEVKAHAEKLGAQLEEAKSQIRTIEAHHKGKEAEERIKTLKAKAHEIDKKHHSLKTIGEVATAVALQSLKSRRTLHKLKNRGWSNSARSSRHTRPRSKYPPSTHHDVATVRE